MSIIVYLTNLAINLVEQYGYSMLFVLMTLESSSIPVPSEVVMTLAGALASKGMLDFWIAYVVTLSGSTLGMLIDYYIGFFIGKDVLYKHMKIFRIKKKTFEKFDGWFERNAVSAIFLSRLLPVVRTWMSFPAGFVKMPMKKFLFYSISGSAIWDLVLMIFGFYAFNTNKAVIWLASIGILAIVLYSLYRIALRSMKN